VFDSRSESGAQYLLLTRLADEFAARYRAGERPSLQQYVDRYPELAGDIRELFPAMAEIEQVREDRQGATQPAAEPDSPPLRQVGDFRIIREDGKGGMGIAYEAEQVSLGRHVALTVLPRSMIVDAQARRRRSEVYSLGLTLYEMLAFRPALDKKDRRRLIKQVTDEEPSRLGKLNRQVAHDRETIVHKAIEKDARARFTSAIALSADDSWLAAQGSHGSVDAWDMNQGSRLLALPDEHGFNWALAWSPNREFLAAGYSDGRLALCQGRYPAPDASDRRHLSGRLAQHWTRRARVLDHKVAGLSIRVPGKAGR
jgi:hypothetical protein